MRKHGGFTACAGAGRIRPQARDRRAQGRTAVLSARHRLFRKANAHRREPQVPQGQPGHQGFQVYRESQGCRESQALIFRGGHARNRVVFINSGREHGKRGPPPESLGITDLALCLRVARGRQMRGPRGPERALRGPSRGLALMKTTRFLAGVPCFSATEVSRGAWAGGCAGASSPARASRIRIELLRAVESRRRANPSPRQAILLQSNSSKYYVFVILLPWQSSKTSTRLPPTTTG